MMNFPTFVYACPGPHFGPHGTTYRLLDVASQEELDEALALGWHLLLVDAVDAHLAPPTEPPAVPDAHADAQPDGAPPTRAEMVEQASRLGIRVDRRWSDETLLAKIGVAMTAPAAAPLPPADAADNDPI